jgi:hypothetical protein
VLVPHQRVKLSCIHLSLSARWLPCHAPTHEQRCNNAPGHITHCLNRCYNSCFNSVTPCGAPEELTRIVLLEKR